MITKIIVPGRFPSLNEWIDANRRKRGNWSPGNDMKKRDQRAIKQYIPRGLRLEGKGKLFLEYTFYEPNTRRDLDNINGYFHKVFQDALVEAGVIDDDDQKHIRGMTDYFDVDKKFPRVEITIEVTK